MTTAGDRLAELLSEAAAPGAPSVRLRAEPDDLRLEVEGVGPIRLPVPPEQARRLCRIGQRAPFGRGEETLTDPDVRDTWEIPKTQVRIEWSDAFGSILDVVREELGLPSACGLTAGLHSMLIYEPGQFFVAHQDSEKDDAMVATLVVGLPSDHTGGALVIDHGGETTTYRGSKTALTLVAFYADCRHEVRPVKTGHRVTLTYNLLLTGDTSQPVAGDDPTVAELASCLDDHFAAPVTHPYRRGQAEPPSRLVYLLDYEYTARGLSWSRLKGTDADRASLLRAAADREGYEAVLALADVHETWNACESGPRYGSGSRYWYDDVGDDGDKEDEYELDELIESAVQLLHWAGPAGAGMEEISLAVGDDEVCASTPSAGMRPYSSEYEGYMGNYGNTMDRWYRRAAVVVWPRDRAFRNRAEASPAWALDELCARVRAKDVAGARAAAATLAPFWDSAARAGAKASLLGKALRAASAVDDAEIAAMLLGPFRIERLRPSHAAPLAKLARKYSPQWLDALLQAWFGVREAWASAGEPERTEWLTSLPRLCEALHATGSPGTATAHRVLELSWGGLSEAIRQWLANPSPSYRAQWLGGLGLPLAAVLTAAAATGAGKLRDEVVGFVRGQDDEVIACVLPALRAAGKLPAGSRRVGGFDDLAAGCAARLTARLDRPPRADDDWSVDLPDGCGCELCGTLGVFLRDRARRTFEWPLAKDRRKHVHFRVDSAELPVRHETRRQGRPYTLVLSKTPALFAHERQARNRDEADLEWLTGQWQLAREPER